MGQYALLPPQTNSFYNGIKEYIRQPYQWTLKQIPLHSTHKNKDINHIMYDKKENDT